MPFTLTPLEEPQRKGFTLTPYASDGAAAVRSVFPGAQITSGHRTGNVGYANDDHHLTSGAVDLAPIKGMTFDQFTGKLKEAGYPIIQAIDEVNHPSGRSTGPHWHVSLGERKEKQFTLTPVGGPQSASKAPGPSGSPQPPNRAQRAGNRPQQGNEETVLGDIGQGIRNIPSSAVAFGKGLIDAARHPIRTGEGLWDIGQGAIGEAAEKVGLKGKQGPRQQRERRAFDTAASDVMQTLRHPASSFAKDPVNTAFTLVPAGGAALKGVKLGVKGADAARLATMTPEARAALRTQRVEDAAHASKYGAIQRQVVGRHSLDRDRAIDRLQKHQRIVGNASVDDQRAVVAAVESASKGGIRKLPEKYRAAAYDLRKVAQTYRQKIEDVMKREDGSGPNFIKDYYAHLWKRDPKATSFFSGKQGSGHNLKERKFMTLQEGLDAGLTPLHENPLDQMSAYVDNMSKYLQAHDIQSTMRKSGLARWVPERNIPEGWHKLDGINTTREARTIRGSEEADTLDRQLPRRVLAAPRAAAVKYNNFVAPGLETKLRSSGHTGWAGAYKAARGATSATSNVVLSFSGFHPTLVAGKAVASDIGNAITHTFRGQPVKALKSIAHAPIAPIRPLVDKLTGKMSMKGRLLSGDQAMTQIDKLWRDAGGRLKSGSEYRASIRPNLLHSALRGTFKRDIAGMAKGIAGKDKHWTERVSATADAAGRIMDATSSAIFDHFVPAMKRQAFEREMAANLKPGMSETEQKALARRVMDNVSGRMGELEQDNIFWSQWKTDIGRLLILSPSWQYGDFKVLNDAAGKGRTAHGVAQAAALVGTYYLMNGVANYMHTGQRPEGQDWIAYRTGGTTQDRTGEHPERAMVPSIMKDFFAIPADPIGEAGNKMTPLPRALWEVARNSDWRGDPIYRPTSLSGSDLPPGAPDNMKENRGLAALGHVAGSLNPIGLQENPNGPNSGISTTSHILFGERPAGQRFYDPEGYDETQKYFAKKRVQDLIRAERRDAAKKRRR